MPKASVIMTNFSSGELSPRLDGRVDLQQYYNACRTLENMVVTSHGNADRRPGTYYVATAKTLGDKVRLIPYIKDASNKYILEFGDEYIRVYKDHDQVTGPYEIVSPYAVEDLFELKFYNNKNELYIVHPSYALRKIVCTDDTHFTLSTPTLTGWDESTVKNITGATNASPIVITSVAHGFVNGDKVFIKDIEGSIIHPPQTGGSIFNFSDISIVVGMIEINDCSFEVANKTADTFELKGTDGTNYKTYVSGGTVRKVGSIFASADNYPACLTFFEGRMIIANTNNNQNKIFGSKSNEYTDFEFGVNDGDAWEYGVPTENAIRWLTAKSDILIGTEGDEWILSGGGYPITPTNVTLKRQSSYGSANIQALPINENIFYIQKGFRKIREFGYNRDQDTYLSPDVTNLAEHVSNSGISCVAIQQNPDTIFWGVTNDGDLIGLTYERMYGIMGWHRHLFDGVVESIAIIPLDEDEIWISIKRTIEGVDYRYIEYFKPRDFGEDQTDCFFVNSGITFDGGDPVVITGATKADPIVITAVAHGFLNDQLVKIVDVEGMTELNQRVYMVKNKTADTFELSLTDESDMIDSSLFTTYTSGGTAAKVWTSLTGLDHLEGKEVSMLCDGAVQPNKTVVSGEIELKYEANKIHVGLPFTSKLKPMRLEAGSGDGTAQGKTKKIHGLTLRFYKTIGCKVGPDEDSQEIIVFRLGSDLMDNPTELFTGDKNLAFPGRYETDGNILITQDQPLPLSISAIIVRMATNG
jgi:hypothetical protein